MSKSLTNTETSDTRTASVEVHYTRFIDDRDDEAFDLTRDIRVHARPGDITAEVFDLAYEKVHGGEVSLEDVLSPEKANVVLSHIYSRMQDGRVDDELSYDGSETRSMMVGDIIILNDVAFLVGPSSFPVLGEADYFTGAATGEEVA